MGCGSFSEETGRVEPDPRWPCKSMVSTIAKVAWSFFGAVLTGQQKTRWLNYGSDSAGMFAFVVDCKLLPVLTLSVGMGSQTGGTIIQNQKPARCPGQASVTC